MGRTAILAIRIIGDASSAVVSMGDVDRSAGMMQASMARASLGAGIALGGLALAASAAGQAASEAQQAVGAVDSVFGEYSDRVHGYAADAANAVGLSKTAYENLASVIGSQLKNMGVPMEQVADQTNTLVGLGADLSATFGGTTSDAVSALSSLLRGERDPIERYGVSINQAAVDAQKAAMGLSGLSGEADKNANLQATLALLTQQTSAAQGQFGREADTAAGQQQRANAMWDDAIAKLGEQLLPILTEGASILSEFATWVGDNSELVNTLAVVIGVLAAGVLIINGAMEAFSVIQAVQTAAQWANNAAWLASPITWIILAVIAAIAILIAIIVLVVQNWDLIKDTAADVWQSVIDWLDQARIWLEQNIINAIQSVIQFFTDLGTNVANAFESVIKWLSDAYDWILKLIGSAVPGWLTDLLGGGGFSAKIAVDDLPTPAPMAFSAAETMAGFSYGMEKTATAPSFTALSAAVPPVGTDAGTFADRPGQTIINNHYDIKVEGAIDKDGTARTIKKLLTNYDTQNGSLASAGGTRKW